MFVYLSMLIRLFYEEFSDKSDTYLFKPGTFISLLYLFLLAFDYCWLKGEVSFC